MDAIVVPHGRRTKDPWVMKNLASLLGSLYLYVWASVSMPGGIDEARYIRARKTIVETLRKAREAIRVKGVEEEDAWEGWQEIGAADIDNAALKVNRHGWLEGDWAAGIEDLVQRQEGIEIDGEDGDGNGTDNIQTDRIKRADTMFQDRYDFLSEHKRKEYASWKEGILNRIKELENGTDAMEIDS